MPFSTKAILAFSREQDSDIDGFVRILSVPVLIPLLLLCYFILSPEGEDEVELLYLCCFLVVYRVIALC